MLKNQSKIIKNKRIHKLGTEFGKITATDSPTFDYTKSKRHTSEPLSSGRGSMFSSSKATALKQLLAERKKNTAFISSSVDSSANIISRKEVSSNHTSLR